nr:hypothetical protein [Actinomycetota bacterium]
GDWAWPVLAALVVAVLVTAAVIALGAGRESAGPAAATVTMPLGSSVATETTEVPAEPVPTLAAPPEDEPLPTVTGPPDAGAARMVEWPAGRDGFTVVLASLPQDGGREPAMQRARDAGQAGLREVGVLDSDEYSSLHPGYYVVFSGVFSTRPRAEASVQAARDGGYGDAYVSPVAR